MLLIIKVNELENFVNQALILLMFSASLIVEAICSRMTIVTHLVLVIYSGTKGTFVSSGNPLFLTILSVKKS
jgi:hypothetical protein